MLKCRDVLAQGSAYIDGAQTARERLALRAHLLICGHCRQYLRSLRLTAASVQSLRLPVTEAEVTRILESLPGPE